MPDMPLKAEFDYYVAHQDELVAKYRGRVLVIKNREVIGDFATEVEALSEMSKKLPVGTFLIQRCEPGSENYTATYHSRVEF